MKHCVGYFISNLTNDFYQKERCTHLKEEEVTVETVTSTGHMGRG